MKLHALTTVLGCCLAVASAHAQSSKQTIAITGATVHTSPTSSLKNATIVIRDGKIASVGVGAKVPANAKVIDGRGKVVTAGFIDSSTSVGLVEVSQVSEANDGYFVSSADDKVHAAFRVVDGYNDNSVAIPVARLGGVTSVVAAPRGSLISGQSALMRLTTARSADTVVRAPLAMVATLGGRSLGGRPSRGVVIERLRELLDDAREYRKVKGRYQRNQTRRFAAERLDLEALQPVVTGTMPLLVRAHRSSDLLAAARLATELRIKVIIEGGTEAWLVAKELAKAKIPVLLDPVANLPSDFDRIRVRSDAAAVLNEAGVTVAISTLGSASGVRRLRQLAGNAVANGLPWAKALDAVTTAPARIFGLKGLGEIKRGVVADLVLWSSDPFELATRVEAIVIAGELMPLASRQTLLRDRYRRLPSP